MFDVARLNELYEELSADRGMDVGDFHRRLKKLFELDRSDSDTNYDSLNDNV